MYALMVMLHNKTVGTAEEKFQQHPCRACGPWHKCIRKEGALEGPQKQLDRRLEEGGFGKT